MYTVYAVVPVHTGSHGGGIIVHLRPLRLCPRPRSRPTDRPTDSSFRKLLFSVPAILTSAIRRVPRRRKKKTSLNGDRPDSRGKCHVMQHVRFVDAVAWVIAIGQNIYCANWITCWINAAYVSTVSSSIRTNFTGLSFAKWRYQRFEIWISRDIWTPDNIWSSGLLRNRPKFISGNRRRREREETQQVYIAASLHCRQFTLQTVGKEQVSQSDIVEWKTFREYPEGHLCLFGMNLMANLIARTQCALMQSHRTQIYVGICV